jgi:hypothetical protein
LNNCNLAKGVGFEPTVQLPRLRFSKPEVYKSKELG